VCVCVCAFVYVSVCVCESVCVCRGNKEGTDYESGRDESAFVDFINEATGTQRTVGGGFTEMVRVSSSSIFIIKQIIFSLFSRELPLSVCVPLFSNFLL